MRSNGCLAHYQFIYYTRMASHARKIIVIGAAGVALAAAGVLPSYVFAASDSPTHVSSATHRRLKFEHLGTVSAVADSSITLATKGGTTYTVDVQNARIVKAGTTVPLATVVVGDPIVVIGPTHGTTIDARTVFDKPAARLEHRLERRWAHHRGTIIGGTIATISSGEFTLVPKGHPGRPARPSILIDTNATTVVTRAGQPVPFSALGVNSEVIVSGTREAKDAPLLASKIIIRNRQ